MFSLSHAAASRARAVAVVGFVVACVASFARAQQPQSPSPAAPATPATPAAPAIVPFAPASTPEQEQLRLVHVKRYPGKVHVLPATMETTQWGWFNNAQPPVLHVDAGDTVIFETMMHSHNQVVPGTTIEQIKKLRTDFPGRGPHTLTGPVHIEGAEPGDTLRIRINRIVPRAYGTNFNVPGMFGQFPDKFPDGQVKYFVPRSRPQGRRVRAGHRNSARPFPGTIGVARAEPGQYSSVPPGSVCRQPGCPRSRRGHDPLCPGIRQGRPAVDRRFPRRPGQRRDQPHGAGDRRTRR